ncbi:MAG: hypothetical protein K6F69_00080 [Treponema sp.]|nr:hypothetical protein [Treponema sp.]
MKNIILFSILALFTSSNTIQLPAEENTVSENAINSSTDSDTVIAADKEDTDNLTDIKSSQTEKVQSEELPVWKEKDISEIVDSNEAILQDKSTSTLTDETNKKTETVELVQKENTSSKKNTSNKVKNENKKTEDNSSNNIDNTDYIKYYSIQSQMLEQSSLEQSESSTASAIKTSQNSNVNKNDNKADGKAVLDKQNTNKETSSEAEVGIVPSKNIELPVYRLFHVTYPSREWTYLGEVRTENTEKNKKLVSYISESTNGNQTSFTLRTNHTGNSLLHFYKNDKLTGENIDDYISVSITGTEIAISQEEASDNSQKEENNFSSSAPTLTEDAVITEDKTEESYLASKESNSEAENSTQNSHLLSQHTESVDPTSFSIKNRIIEVDNPEETDELLQKAKDSYDNKNYSEAKSLIDSFFTSAITNLDKGLYLQGMILEANSPIQNMRGALKSYQNIIDNYPSSSYAKAAKEKTIYLERFYFDIR